MNLVPKLFSPTSDERTAVAEAVKGRDLIPKSILERYYLQLNHTYREIALSFGITDKKATYSIEHHNLHKTVEQKMRPRGNEELKTGENLENLVKSGMTRKAIGKVVGVSEGAVRKLLETRHIPYPYPGVTVKKTYDFSERSLKKIRKRTHKKVDICLSRERIRPGGYVTKEASKRKSSLNIGKRVVSARNNPTSPERAVIKILQEEGLAFTFQVGVFTRDEDKNERGGIVDFFIDQLGHVLMEVDGVNFHTINGVGKFSNAMDIKKRDMVKNTFLPVQGFVLIRLKDTQVNRENVLKVLNFVKGQTLPSFVRLLDDGTLHRILGDSFPVSSLKTPVLLYR